MKRVLKIALAVIGLIILIIVGFLAYVGMSPIPSYANEAPELTIESTPQRVEEGARIASMMCASCHRSDDRRLGGSHMPDASDFGYVYAPNITQHPQHGIADYTDGELAYLFRTGIKKDGQYAPPWMPKFPHLSDEDLASIIAFLRSDHPLVQPSDKPTEACEPNFMAKFLARVAFKPLPYPEESIKAPSPNNEVEFGKYLAVAKFDCYQCHSADFKTNSSLNPTESVGFMAGGNPIPDLEGNRVISANLTMDNETGLGTWTKAQFSKALRTGIRPDGTSYKYPMLPMAAMTDAEAGAIWEYLKTLPTVRNEALLGTSDSD